MEGKTLIADKNELSINLDFIHQKPNSPISPPSPLTPSQPNASSYSLFQNDYGWLSSNNSPLVRKQTEEFGWKRAQACTLCFDKKQQLLMSSCGQHHFCHSCCQSTPLLLQGTCPFCVQTNHVHDSPLKSELVLTHPVTFTPQHYPCVKLTNIPWDVSQHDVRQFFINCRSPSTSTYTQCIHIMMDRTTGKTLSDAYVEFATLMDMKRAIEQKNQKPLKGRIVSVIECSQEELLSVVFPKWRGQFQGISAIPPATEIVKSMSTAAGGGNSGCPPFITREEINSLLVVCKNYKLHFSRKCAERPFENIISVITKHPWHQAHLFISTMHRDHIYEMLKLSIESLKIHLAKDYVQIDTTLLERLVRAGIMCPAFTERQKTTLLQTARIECPVDLVSHLVSPIMVSLAPPGLQIKNTEYNVPSILFTPNSPVLKLPTGLKQPKKTQLHTQEPWEDNLLSSPNSPISSLIRDIQQHCYIDDFNRKPTNAQPPLAKNGIPLLFQPINPIEHHYYHPKQQKQPQLSPWTSSKSNASDIWRMSPAVESNHVVSSESLLIA
ncbi:hypothetical protein CU098_010501 [Rhizopus stolonifer]|uniref:RRM domain-containing protein n=1 Tax=Rhizopus stolonifer TaxID=4846 RepID=A0A367KNE3_RHIST|nr:hypothetical protein CU098_010501 [Rhizopus stolonifer]